MFLLSVDHHLDKFISFRQELYLDTRVDSGNVLTVNQNLIEQDMIVLPPYYVPTFCGSPS